LVSRRFGSERIPGGSVKVLPASFYDRRTTTVARELLGKVLRVRTNRIWRSGVILETEAYVRNDPANHAFHGPNKRNESMFKGPGTAYVYRIHQVFCVNAVTHRGEAVLIRAIQPLENINLRTDGPGRLCQALNITKNKHDGKPLTGDYIQVLEGHNHPFTVSVSKRIGVTKGKNRLLRFLAREKRNRDSQMA
jgi:DNA-3-methyladenine glycosylase